MRIVRVSWLLLGTLAAVACSSEAPQNGTGFPYPVAGSGGAGGATSSAGTTGVGGSGLNGGAGATSSAGTDAGMAGSVTGGVSGASGSAGSAGAGGSMAGNGGAGGSTSQPPQPDARGIYGHPDPSVEYPTYDGFKPYLIEEFNQPLDLDHDPNWTWGDGALGDGLTRMVKDNISFADGKMKLTVTSGNAPGGYSFSTADNVATRDLKSGELRTIYNNFRYGRYEVRMKAPSTGVNYIFTMFAYRTPAFLQWREIDIEIEASPRNSFITNLIIAPPESRVWMPQFEDKATSFPSGAGAGGLPAGFDTRNDFHTYAFEWLPTTIKWFVDGQLIRVKQSNDGKVPVPQVSTKIFMNLWIFPNGDLGGDAPAGNTYPIVGEYDWFRFYRWNQDETYPCANTPSCLPADDLKYAKNNVSDPLPDVRPDKCTSVTGMLDVACGP